MKKPKVTEEQIVLFHEGVRSGGLTQAGYFWCYVLYILRKTYGGIYLGELKHMQQREEGSLWLKNMLDKLSLDCRMWWRLWRVCANGFGTCRHATGARKARYFLYRSVVTDAFILLRCSNMVRISR